MKKIVLLGVFFMMGFVACNKSNDSSNTIATPPMAPSNQCLTTTSANVYPANGNYYNNPYYNNYSYYNNPYYYNSYGNSYYPYGTNNYAYNNGTCSPQVYNNYNQYGFMAYPYTNWSNYNNLGYIPLCNCPVNYRPVYSGSIGLGCVAVQYFNPISVGAYYWSLAPNNYQWVNWTQVSNTSTNLGNLTNCYQQVAMACYTDQPNSCGTGFTCRATAGGSRLGICTQQ